MLMQTLVYIAALEIVAAFGLQHIFRLFRDDIEHLLATFTGVFEHRKRCRQL